MCHCKIFVTGYALSSQVGSRGLDSRGKMILDGLVKKMRFLGDGEDLYHFVHNHGKTNCVGRVMYKAFAPHRNLRMDSSAHCLGEPFPNFLEPKDYAKRHLFRSSKAYWKQYPPSTQYSNCIYRPNSGICISYVNLYAWLCNFNPELWRLYCTTLAFVCLILGFGSHNKCYTSETCFPNYGCLQLVLALLFHN
jgi:hypothetical protein